MNALPYQAMLQQMPDSVIFADTQGIIRFWNAASEKMFGFSAAEAVGLAMGVPAKAMVETPAAAMTPATIPAAARPRLGRFIVVSCQLRSAGVRPAKFNAASFDSSTVRKLCQG